MNDTAVELDELLDKLLLCPRLELLLENELDELLLTDELLLDEDDCELELLIDLELLLEVNEATVELELLLLDNSVIDDWLEGCASVELELLVLLLEDDDCVEDELLDWLDAEDALLSEDEELEL